MTVSVEVVPTSCLVADDHPAVVEAVADVLSEHGIEVAGRARDGHEAAQKIEASQPQVALLDLRMPGLSGIEVARRVGRSSPGTAVILYTAFGDRALLTEALDAGARGFVLKEAPLAEVVRAVELVASGRTYVDPVLAERLGGAAWCYEVPGLAHGAYGCERFSSMVAWAYWPSPDNAYRPRGPSDESATLPADEFRALLDGLLGRPRLAASAAAIRTTSSAAAKPAKAAKRVAKPAKRR